MPVSRRRFLGVAAAIPWAVRDGFARGPLTDRLAGLTAPRADSGAPRCVLADLGADCALPESLAGFERGLRAASVGFERVAASEISPARLILVPGAVLRSAGTAETLASLAAGGSTVVYESGAAYADSEGLASEQRLLARYFGVRVDAALDLWSLHEGVAFAPYVHYAWPSKAIVRDFSRARPVRSAAAIAYCAGLPVACRGSAGRGTFVYLGSALGPHLSVSDPEALALLKGLVAGA
jgi:hypothetical protein